MLSLFILAWFKGHFSQLCQTVNWVMQRSIITLNFHHLAKLSVNVKEEYKHHSHASSSASHKLNY